MTRSFVRIRVRVRTDITPRRDAPADARAPCCARRSHAQFARTWASSYASLAGCASARRIFDHLRPGMSARRLPAPDGRRSGTLVGSASTAQFGSLIRRSDRDRDRRVRSEVAFETQNRRSSLSRVGVLHAQPVENLDLVEPTICGRSRRRGSATLRTPLRHEAAQPIITVFLDEDGPEVPRFTLLCQQGRPQARVSRHYHGVVVHDGALVSVRYPGLTGVVEPEGLQ